MLISKFLKQTKFLRMFSNSAIHYQPLGIPFVIENDGKEVYLFINLICLFISGRVERSYDIYSRLLKVINYLFTKNRKFFAKTLQY